MIAIAGPQVSGLAHNVEGLGHVPGHEFDRLIVEVGISLYFIVRKIMGEGGGEPSGQTDSLLKLGLVDLGQKILDSAGGVADWKGTVVGRQEAGSRVSACNDHAGGKNRIGLAEEHLGPRTELGMGHARPLAVTGVHDVTGLRMSPGLGRHGTNDGEVVGLGGQLGQLVGKLQIGALGCDGPAGASEFLGILWVEGVDLTHSSPHV
jgi:hypothetical protein